MESWTLNWWPEPVHSGTHRIVSLMWVSGGYRGLVNRFSWRLLLLYDLFPTRKSSGPSILKFSFLSRQKIYCCPRLHNPYALSKLRISRAFNEKKNRASAGPEHLCKRRRELSRTRLHRSIEICPPPEDFALLHHASYPVSVPCSAFHNTIFHAELQQ